MMHTQRNWVLAFLAIAGGAIFMASLSVLMTDTDLPEGYAKLFAADSSIKDELAPDIAGEWIDAEGDSAERFKIVQSKPESTDFDVYEIRKSKPDELAWRFQWNSKLNTFVGKRLMGTDKKLNISIRMIFSATVENDGTKILIRTSLDPETFDRILKKHGKQPADDMLKEGDNEFVWTRMPANEVAQAADQNPVPAIGGVWLMGDRGSFGKCNIVRSATEGYAFDVYTLKSVLSSNVSQSGPAYRLKWNSGAKTFEASAQLSNDPKQPGKVSVTMTVEDDGKSLKVKSTPDEAGMNTLESLKQKGINQETIDQLLDMKWTREKENQQGWTLADELLGALSQAKPPAGLVGHGQGGFGGGFPGGAGGQNNPNPGAGGQNSLKGAGGGNNPNNVPGVGGGAFGRLLDEDQPAAPRRRAFGRMFDEEDNHPQAGQTGMGMKMSPARRIETRDILLVETNEGLSAYSKSLGKWSVLKVGRPKDGSSRFARSTVKDQFASVIIDDQLYGFGGQVGEWDRLSIPQEFLAEVNPVHGANLCLVVIGDKPYVLSSKTGKWTASSDQATQPPSFSTTISSTEIENWRQQQSGKVDSQKLAEEISEREATAVEIAKQIRKIKSENPHASDDSLEIQKLRADLEKTLTTTFALKSKLESSRVQELQSRVGRLEQQLIRREYQRTKIIERHLRELIDGEETDWKMEPEKEDNPQPLQTGGGFF